MPKMKNLRKNSLKKKGVKKKKKIKDQAEELRQLPDGTKRRQPLLLYIF
jgi:hypothetical protein